MELDPNGSATPPGAKTAPAPASDPEPAPAPKPIVPRRVAPEVIRSLYGSDGAGLKRSIGLNDRFLMIRDMFDGDSAAFDRAIARLDTFTDLDEAVIWIHDNFDWSADNQGAAMLMALLERKLGR
jgi:hypothetical protein